MDPSIPQLAACGLPLATCDVSPTAVGPSDAVHASSLSLCASVMIAQRCVAGCEMMLALRWRVFLRGGGLGRVGSLQWERIEAEMCRQSRSSLARVERNQEQPGRSSEFGVRGVGGRGAVIGGCSPSSGSAAGRPQASRKLIPNTHDPDCFNVEKAPRGRRIGPCRHTAYRSAGMSGIVGSGMFAPQETPLLGSLRLLCSLCSLCLSHATPRSIPGEMGTWKRHWGPTTMLPAGPKVAVKSLLVVLGSRTAIGPSAAR
jgi:hypothetical protein